MAMQRVWRATACFMVVALCLVLPACGGGGGGGNSAGSSMNSVSLPASAASLNDPNVVQVVVRAGPANNVNIPYVSVTICVPGTSNCRTITDVMVDTGSYGLRLFASQVTPFLALPSQTVGSSSVISECANFLNASTWGGISLADVSIGGERAHNLPIQLMDANDVLASANCGGTLMATPDTVATASKQPLSANGILGVGVFSNDGQNYFDCTSRSIHSAQCSAIVPAASEQVHNPVGLLATNTHGVVLLLPSLRPSGMATAASGYLIFGVNTQSNNQLGAANVVPLDASGFFTTIYHNLSMTRSFIDSGSNGLYFDDPNTAVLTTNCTSTTSAFYCPASTVPLSATIQLASGSTPINFSIASADTRGNNYALDGLGGTLFSGSFDWGLPFFYGRSVYTVMEGAVPNAATGSLPRPFYAFTN